MLGHSVLSENSHIFFVDLLPGGSWALIFIRFKNSAQLFRGFLLRFSHCLSYTTPAFGKCAEQEKSYLLEGSQASFRHSEFYPLVTLCQWEAQGQPLAFALCSWQPVTVTAEGLLGLLLLTLPSPNIQFLCSHSVSSNRMPVNRSFIDFI